MRPTLIRVLRLLTLAPAVQEPQSASSDTAVSLAAAAKVASS